jgi:hypothetical protein
LALLGIASGAFFQRKVHAQFLKIPYLLQIEIRHPVSGTNKMKADSFITTAMRSDGSNATDSNSAWDIAAPATLAIRAYGG